MNRTLKFILTVVVSVCTALTVNAQDLSSQRGESQDLGSLLGHRLDHAGLVINPTPQAMYLVRSLPADISRGVALKGEAKSFKEELSFLKQKRRGLKLTINYVEKFAEQSEVPNKSGAYTLKVDHSNGITIEAYDELAAFYAIQTLRQIMESERVKSEGTIPAMTIRDWPDLKYRGVVEGFYGEPWSHEARLSLIDFYGRFKMNYYVYGPKDDPYHSSP